MLPPPSPSPLTHLGLGGVCLLTVLCLLVFSARAQVPDSLNRRPPPRTASPGEAPAEKARLDSMWAAHITPIWRAETYPARRRARRDSLATRWPIPGRATRMSLLLPGLGQVYNAGIGRSDVSNGSKWVHLAKVPIIYGAIGVTLALAIRNGDKYAFYREAYANKYYNEANLGTVGYVPRTDNFPGVSSDALRQQRDAWRRVRDQAYFWTIVFYAMNSIEAYVGAHLRKFDVSDDLSLQVTPSATPLPNYGMAFGGRITLTLGR